MQLNLSELSPLERTFYGAQPVRELLLQHCSLRDYFALLQTSWAMYTSHERTGSDADKRTDRLSKYFFESFLCLKTIHWIELEFFLKKCIEQCTANGINLRLVDPSSRSRRTVTIAIQPWISAQIKFYCDNSVQPADWSRSYPFIEEMIYECDPEYRVTLLITWIVQQLEEHNIIDIDTKCTEFCSRDLLCCVFNYRWRQFCTRAHRQYLANVLQSNEQTLKTVFMRLADKR